MSGFFSGKDKERDQHKPEHEPGKHEPGKHKPGDKPEREREPGKQPEQQPTDPHQQPGQQPVKPNQELGQPPGRREDEQQQGQDDPEAKRLRRQSEGSEERLRRGERTTTTPDSVTGEEAETKPVGEFDQMSSTERLEFLRGWGQRNRLGGPMSAAWEEFDGAVGEEPPEAETKGRGERRQKQADKAKKSGESHSPFESEQRLP